MDEGGGRGAVGDGVENEREYEAAGRVEVGFARNACKGFPLVRI